MATYWEKLKDPRWQKKRLEVLERDKFTCITCGDTESTLHVHHGYYEKGLEPWEYELNTLWTLCEECHKVVQNDLLNIHAEIARCHPGNLPELLGKVHFANVEFFIADEERKKRRVAPVAG